MLKFIKNSMTELLEVILSLTKTKNTDGIPGTNSLNYDDCGPYCECYANQDRDHTGGW